MKDTSRALRRHHTRRMHVRAAKMVESWGWLNPETPEFHRMVCMVRDRMAFCSCLGCGGNPRKNKWVNGKEQLTMAERRALDDYRSQLEDLC